MRARCLVQVLGASQTGKTRLVAELERHLAAQGRVVCTVATSFGASMQPPVRDEDHCLDRPEAHHAALQRACHSDVDLIIVEMPSQPWPSKHLGQSAGNTADQEGLSLLPSGDSSSRPCLRLLTSLDLAWQLGLSSEQRLAQEAQDECWRQWLAQQGLPFTIVAGTGEARSQHALATIEHWLRSDPAKPAARQRTGWRWYCQECGEGDCEQHWLTRAMAKPVSAPRS
jgi:hypothetical protein